MNRNEGISVTELNQLISEGLKREPRLRNVTVTAEVSGFKHHMPSGHWYFSLKDADSAISCVMFRQNTFRSAIRPADGDRVTVLGYVELYIRDGKIQLYVTEMKKAGSGSLYEQFEILKQKLNAEGLFDPARKKILPVFPRKVAVITSPSGAALHDILNVSAQRCPSIPIVLIQSLVQGPDAPQELTEALRKAALIPEADVIILGRGGGSAEDLWCFNDEAVVRAVASCPVPVVTGIGHETDTTLCDYASDVRASTPSNAAEIVFPDRNEVKGRTGYFRSCLLRSMQAVIHRNQLSLYARKDQLMRLSPGNRIFSLAGRSAGLRQQLMNCMTDRLRERETEKEQLRNRLSLAVGSGIIGAESEIRRLRTGLSAISPLKVLERGYVLALDPEGSILPDAASAGKQEQIRLKFRDGMVRVRREEHE